MNNMIIGVGAMAEITTICNEIKSVILKLWDKKKSSSTLIKLQQKNYNQQNLQDSNQKSTIEDMKISDVGV